MCNSGMFIDEMYIDVYDETCDECNRKYNESLQRERDLMDDDDGEPFIDFIDGTIFQTNSYIELLSSYSKYYINNEEKTMTLCNIDKKRFRQLFSKSVIMNDFKQTDTLKKIADVIVSYMIKAH